MSDTSREAHLVGMARRGARRSLLILLVVITIQAVLLDWASYPRWRIVSLNCLILGTVVIQAAYIGITRGTPRAYVISVYVVSAVVVLGSTELVGGLNGPFIVALPLLPMRAAVLYGRHRVTVVMTLVALAILLLLATIPQDVFGPPLPSPQREILTCFCIVLVMLNRISDVLKLVAAREADFARVQHLREEKVADLRSNLARVQLVSSKIAHELKNPLATVKGLAQLLARASDSPTATERLDVVRREIDRMEIIIRDYLTFSRPLESLSAQATDLANVVTDVVEIMSARAEAASVSLVHDLRPSPLQADARRVKEALINLVSNALEATPRGGRVALVLRPRDGGVQLEIRDTGRGIEPPDLEKLGTPFYTTRPDGTGLGLVMARTVVEQHGGKLSIASEPGRGTTVTIALPSAPSHTSEPLSGLGAA